MIQNAATYGTFSGIRVVKGRKVAVLEIEIPLERANDALTALGGVPLPEKEPWVAVALLKEEPKKTPPANAVRSLQGREAYANKDEMEKAVTRAALLCRDLAFQRFIGGSDEDGARVALCAKIGVFSRKGIGINPDAYRAFLNLESEYRTHQQVSGYPPHLTGARQ